MTEYRASFDASVSFSNGGDLAVHGLRVDVLSPDIDETVAPDYLGRVMCFAILDPSGLAAILPGILAQMRQVTGPGPRSYSASTAAAPTRSHSAPSPHPGSTLGHLAALRARRYHRSVASALHLYGNGAELAERKDLLEASYLGEAAL